MTILIADIGNSRIKWGVARGARRARAVAATPAATRNSRPALRATLRQLLRRHAPALLVIGSVVPAATRIVTAIAREFLPPKGTLVLDYPAFRRLMPVRVNATVAPGVDRLANALALREDGVLPACSIDAGTAVTWEVVNARGEFIGGAIMPGELLQTRALQAGTAALAAAGTLPRATAAIGTSTARAMAAGVQRGMLHAIAGLLDEMEQELGTPFKRVVITGGDAGRVWRFLNRRRRGVLLRPDLTLSGLACAGRLLRSTSENT